MRSNRAICPFIYKKEALFVLLFLRKKNYFIIRSKQQLDPPPLQPNLKLLTRGLLNFICPFRKKYVFLFRTLHYWLLINMILF